MKIKLYLSLILLLQTSYCFANDCPFLPSDFEDNLYSDETTQEQRNSVAAHFVCRTNTEVIPSKVLIDRGFTIKLVDPQKKIDVFKKAKETGNYLPLFYGDELPKYVAIRSELSQYFSNDIKIVIKGESPNILRDFKAGGQANTVIARFSEIDIHMQQLSQVYYVNACGDNYTYYWQEFQLRQDKLGWFNSFVKFNHCPNIVVAVNPERIITKRGDDTDFYKEFSFVPYQKVWPDFLGNQRLEKFIKEKIQLSHGSYEDKKYSLLELKSLGEVTSDEVVKQLDDHDKLLSDELVKMILKSEEAFINVLDFYDSKNIKYEMRN